MKKQKRVVGLIGKGAGPRVHVNGMAEVEALGRDTDHEVTVTEWGQEGKQRIHLMRDERILIGPCLFVQFEYEGPGRSLICNVHMEA